MNIGILTPTFNREIEIKELYESLRKQSEKDFTWVIVDDGSTDGTESVIARMSKEKKIDIKYIKQENGGKARALNRAFKSIEDIDVFVVVDSDDKLLPNALGCIREKLEKYYEEIEIGAVFFRYKHGDGKIVQAKGIFRTEEVVLSRYEHDSRFSKDDGCIAYFKRAIKKYSYPEFKGEKYVGPTVIQMLMAEKFKIAFTNQVIGVAEYLDGGLTKRGRKLRIMNPYGMLTYCSLMQNKRFNFKKRIKYALMFGAYRYIGKITKEDMIKKNIRSSKLTKWMNWPGVLLGWFWQRRYIK